MPQRLDFRRVIGEQVGLFLRRVVDQPGHHQAPHPPRMGDRQIQQHRAAAPHAVSVHSLQAQRVQHLQQGLAVVGHAHVAFADSVVGIAVSRQLHGQHGMAADQGFGKLLHRSARSRGIVLHHHRGPVRVRVAVNAHLSAGNRNHLAPQAPFQRLRRRRCRRHRRRIRGKQLEAVVQRRLPRGTGINRHAFRRRRQALQLRGEHVSHPGRHEARHGELGNRLAAVMREGAGIGRPVMVAGAEEFQHLLLQALGRGQVVFHARGGAQVVPGKEHQLLAQPRPQPSQMRAVEGGHEGGQIVLQKLGLLLLVECAVAVHGHRGDQVRVAGGCFHRHGGAGMETVKAGLSDAQRADELGHAVGEIGHGEPVSPDRVRGAVARRVGSDNGEMPAPVPHQPHVFQRGLGRLMQQHQAGTIAGAAVVNLAVAVFPPDAHEMPAYDERFIIHVSTSLRGCAREPPNHSSSPKRHGNRTSTEP